MNKLNILSRACNQALFIEPNYAATFFSVLCLKAGVGQLITSTGEVMDADGMQQLISSWDSKPRERPYRVYEGVAVLPVSGTLLHKYGYVQPYSGATGYDGLITRLSAAINDPGIEGILLDFDSPGGEVAGCFDTANLIREFSKVKPIVGLCYDTMCSAAMALGSACTERWITQTGRIGSVGVLVAHYSYEKMLEQEGMEITLIHSGAHKVDGNPYEKLPKDVRNKIQSEIDTTRDQFAQLVSEGIGMPKNDVMATEAAVYTGQSGLAIGFANRVVNGHEAVPLMLEFVKTKKRGGSKMTTATAAEAASSVAAVAGSEATTVPAVNATDLQAQERDRISAILQSSEAEGRASAAQHLALKTSMSATEAIALLAVTPKEPAKAEEPDTSVAMATALDQAMAKTPQPNLQVADGDQLSAEDQNVSRLVAAGNYLKGKA